MSDLHLGERECLLNMCEGKKNIIQTTVEKITELSKGNGEFESEIEKLILIGDIVELSEAKDKRAYETTQFDLSDEEKMLLLEEGRKGAKKFFSWYDSQKASP